MSQPTYEILTMDFGHDDYSPQPGVPHFVTGWRGLRHAIRLLRKAGYEARKGDYATLIQRVDSEVIA